MTKCFIALLKHFHEFYHQLLFVMWNHKSCDLWFSINVFQVVNSITLCMIMLIVLTCTHTCLQLFSQDYELILNLFSRM